MTFLIACGGTGGHLFPGLAVAEVLHQHGHTVHLLISEKQIDTLATQGRDEFQYTRLPAIAPPSLRAPHRWPAFLLRLLRTWSRCRALIRQTPPHAVLGMGGFTSALPLLAARLSRLPAYIHESNAVPGKANRLTARFATRILLGLPHCGKHFPHEKIAVPGTPIRTALAAPPVPRPQAAAHFGLDPSLPTLLILGGSQGATGLNRLLAAALTLPPAPPYQVIHLTGPADETATRAAYAQAGLRAHVAPFCHTMHLAYAAADLVAARSGASTLTELAHYALPSLLVPYPHAADDHQTRNAEVFANTGAALLLPEKTTTPQEIRRHLDHLLTDPQARQPLSEAALSLDRPQAAQSIATLLETGKITT